MPPPRPNQGRHEAAARAAKAAAPKVSVCQPIGDECDRAGDGAQRPSVLDRNGLNCQLVDRSLEEADASCAQLFVLGYRGIAPFQRDENSQPRVGKVFIGVKWIRPIALSSTINSSKLEGVKHQA
jgi:hypothetical protein